MLRLAKDGKPIRVVDDQRLTPTYTVDVARRIAALVETQHSGLYHATSQGDCTGYEFAAKIFREWTIA
jgi:dTDP-4-dehydrorhamnose reductase